MSNTCKCGKEIPKTGKRGRPFKTCAECRNGVPIPHPSEPVPLAEPIPPEVPQS